MLFPANLLRFPAIRGYTASPMNTALHRSWMLAERAYEPRHIVGPTTAARLANDRQRGVTKVGQDDRAVTGHGVPFSRTPGSST